MRSGDGRMVGLFVCYFLLLLLIVRLFHSFVLISVRVLPISLVAHATNALPAIIACQNVWHAVVRPLVPKA